MNKVLLCSLLITLIAISTRAQVCDPTLWEHVYAPNRFTTPGPYNPFGLPYFDRQGRPISSNHKPPCVKATGTVFSASRAPGPNGQPQSGPDGDIHILLTLDRNYEGYMNAKDPIRDGHRRMVIELICKGTVDPRVENKCGTWRQNVAVPHAGDRVEIQGAWVQDNGPPASTHGQNEFHPITSLRIISHAAGLTKARLSARDQIARRAAAQPARPSARRHIAGLMPHPIRRVPAPLAAQTARRQTAATGFHHVSGRNTLRPRNKPTAR